MSQWRLSYVFELRKLYVANDQKMIWSKDYRAFHGDGKNLTLFIKVFTLDDAELGNQYCGGWYGPFTANKFPFLISAGVWLCLLSVWFSQGVSRSRSSQECSSWSN